MGLFFLIAGSLTPPAIARHGAAGFLRERVIRLGLPLAVFIVVLGPLTVALAQTAHGHPFFGTLDWLARHGVIIPGPMWFVEALLIFSAAYVALRADGRPGAPRKSSPFPIEPDSCGRRGGDGRGGVSLASALAGGRGGSGAPDRLFRQLRRAIPRRLPRHQRALA